MQPNGRNAVLLAVAMLMSVVMSGARADDTRVRSTDGQVKNIIKAIANSDRSFEKALDGKFKNSVVRSASGEVDVDKYLDDLRQDVNLVAQRFTDKYAASAEVGNLLTRASVMHAYMRQNPQAKGASDWDLLAGYLGNLAAAYGTTFPPVQGGTARRVGDREVIGVVDELSKLPDSVDSALRKASRSDKALALVSATGSKDLEELSAALKALKSRLNSEKSATAEARHVIVVGDRIDGALRDAALPDSVRTRWQSANQYLDMIARAFALQRAAAPAAAPEAVPKATPDATPGAAPGIVMHGFDNSTAIQTGAA